MASVSKFYLKYNYIGKLNKAIRKRQDAEFVVLVSVWLQSQTVNHSGVPLWLGGGFHPLVLDRWAQGRAQVDHWPPGRHEGRPLQFNWERQQVSARVPPNYITFTMMASCACVTWINWDFNLQSRNKDGVAKNAQDIAHLMKMVKELENKS